MTSAMANNQQQQHQQHMMYYYVAVPGQMQPQVAQGTDGGMMANQQGQMQGGYDPSQQMQGFNMGGDHGGYALMMPQDGSQMGGVNHQMGQMQPTMMAAGNSGCAMQQMVLVTTMMPDQQGQMVMDPNACQACGGQAAPNNWGQGNMAHCNGCSAPQNMPQGTQGMGQGQQVQQQVQMPQKGGMVQNQQATAPAAAPPPSSTTPSDPPAPAQQPERAKPKKGLVNKKLDKNAATQNAGREAGQAGGSAPSAQSSTPAPEPKAPAAESHPTSPSSGGNRESTGQTQTGSRFNQPPLPPLPPKAQGITCHAFASNIKALNLEPMRSAPPKRGSHPSLPFQEGIPRSPGAKAKGPGAPPAALEQQQELQQEAHVPQQAPQPQQAQPPVPEVPQPMAAAPHVPVESSAPAPAPAAQTQALPGASAQSPPVPLAKTPAKKGFKLKNEKLARTGTAKIEDGDAKPEAIKDVKPVVIVQEPVIEAITHDPSRVSLMPENKVFSRELMLRIWQMHKAELHGEIRGLGVSIRPGDSKTPVMDRKRPVKKEEAPDRASVFGTEMKKGPKKEFLPKPSENAYKVKEAPQGRMEELQRNATSLLNKICPDNLTVIVDQLASIKLVKAEELEWVIRIIFKKALAEPHYCETYADMVFALKERYPQFPAENENEKPATFTRVLLNNCQNEFENMPATFEATDEERVKFPNPEELQQELKRKKDMMLANMKFIGHLFLRQLLAVKVIGQVVHDLIGIKENGSQPEEHMIECVCELLQAIGYTLDETTHGENLMNSFQARLKDLSKQLLGDGKQAFSKRIRFAIEDLLDLRRNKWQKKVFKEQAKTKNEVKVDAVGKPGKQGPVEGHFSTQIAGMKPAYIEELKAQRPKKMVAEGGKPSLDMAYVRRICQYFAEDRDGGELETAWKKAQPSPQESKQALVMLVNMGFEEVKKEEAIALVIAELIGRKLVTCEFLKEALQPAIAQLEDWMIDAPQCDIFCQSLLAKLIERDAFNPVLLKALDPLLQSPSQKSLCWKQLVGCLKKLKAKGGSRKALQIEGIVGLAASAKGCPVTAARQQLEDSI